MAKDAYIEAAHKILTDENPVPPSGLSRREIETAIANITKKLAGPMSNVERLWMLEDRQNLRKQLAEKIGTHD